MTASSNSIFVDYSNLGSSQNDARSVGRYVREAYSEGSGGFVIAIALMGSLYLTMSALFWLFDAVAALFRARLDDIQLPDPYWFLWCWIFWLCVLFLYWLEFGSKDKVHAIRARIAEHWTVRTPRFRERITAEDLRGSIGEISQGTTACVPNTLCERCKKIVLSSGLLLGCWYIFTATNEWHDFEESISDMKAHRKETCHLCCRLWNAIDSKVRSKYLAEDRALYDQLHYLLLEEGNIPSSEITTTFGKTMHIRLKLWNGRLQGADTCIQVYRGSEAISKVLLVQRMPLSRGMKQVKCDHSFSTASDHHIELAKEWINSCQLSHKHCARQEAAITSNPSRLIHVVDSSASLRLEIIASDQPTIPYLALSHCWGNQPIFSLTKENFEDGLQQIPENKLSRTFQDAVSITRRLGYSHLWIDSLCIIQNSESDWHAEASKMGMVYSGAVCTIAASCATSSQEGFIRTRNPLAFGLCLLQSNSTSGLFVMPELDDSQQFDEAIESAPLNKRAWVFQERLLSPRTLHFSSDMLFWECHTCIASEASQMGVEYKRYPYQRLDGSYINWERIEQRQRELERLRMEAAYLDRQQDSLIRRQQERQRQTFFSTSSTHYSSGEAWSLQQNILNFEESISSLLGNGRHDNTRITSRSRGDIYASGLPFVRSQLLANPALWPERNTLTDIPWTRGSGYGEAWVGFKGAFETLKLARYIAGNDSSNFGFNQRWYELVGRYSRGALTNGSDKLVAMSGIADAIHRRTNLTYLAGLWKEFLPFNLLWFATMPAPCKPSSYRGPTWSWACLDGTITHDLFPEGEHPDQSLRLTQRTLEVSESRTVPTRRTATDRAGLEFLRVRGYVADNAFLSWNGIGWEIHTRLDDGGGTRCIADLFLDILMERGVTPPQIWLLLVLSFARGKEWQRSESQGLVLTRRPPREPEQAEEDVYERIGLFSTKRHNGPGVHLFDSGKMRNIRIE